MDKPILQLKGITKSFYGVNVLRGVDFEVKPGEIMGLVGENGAGKSTLMKIITGIYTRDGGDIFFEGKSVSFNNATEARDAGISMIHQEFNLFSNLSVAENIFLDRKEYRNKYGVINWKKMRADAKKMLNELGADFDVNFPIKYLSVREKQLVEISKAISTNAKVLIMDEPTGALPESEVQNMFEVIRMLKKRGVAIIYISHRMKEIEQICDRVTVLRDGTVVSVVDMAEGKIDEVISMMIGREIQDYYPHTKREFGDVCFEVKNVTGEGLQDISFSVRQGEVVGLYGLAGAGTTELAEMIMGIRKMQKGTVSFGGKEYKKGSVKAAMEAGIGYVPPDRHQQGVVIKMAVNHNVILSNLSKYRSKLLLHNKKIRNSVHDHIQKLAIKCSGQEQLVLRLSGGNQQKVVLAKWLDRNPSLLILNEPTRGVDVGAKSEIYRLIDQLANQGLSIIFISSELPEILGVSDRIIVFCRGHLQGEYINEGIGQDVLLKAASSTGLGGRDYE